MDTEYLIELYVAGGDREGVAAIESRSSRVAAEMTEEGTAVRFVRSIWMPSDETLFCLFRARSAEVVAEAGHRAAIPYHRIVATDGVVEEPPVSGARGSAS